MIVPPWNLRQSHDGRPHGPESGVAALLALTLVAACGATPTQPTAVPAPPVTELPPAPPTPVPPVPPVPPAPRLTKTKFLAFGDSLTAGTTSPALNRSFSAGLAESYPFKLQNLLAAQYLSQRASVENEGKPNEAAADAVTRFPGVLRANSPEVVILLHGVNDVSFLGLPGVARVAGYINTMAREARLAGVSVIVCTLPPHRVGGFRAAEPAVIARYNEALRDVARGEGAILVDFERGVDLTLIGLDGLHPTEAGYARMADLLRDAIKSRFETSP